MRRAWSLSLVVASAVVLAALAQPQVKPIQECSLRQFQCKNGRCIQQSWMCDGEDDCLDSSDETAEECKNPRTCSPSDFKCANGRCIPKRWMCDNEKDCADGSDEDPSSCQARRCGPEDFACKGTPGECVPLMWVCDDNLDCTDGSDERGCNDTCRSDEFTCANGKCIQQRWVCDGDDDCGDRSEEKNCPDRTCGPNDWTCKDKMCIAAKWRCDGDVDCADHSDEEDCPNKPASVCLAREFGCGDRVTCIHASWVCDGDKDCPGGEDETVEQCGNITCRADQFQCRNRKCIPGNLHCNGRPDCSDYSDEESCVSNTMACKASEWDCGGGMCIPADKVCDKTVDCPNAEDEPVDRCGVNECLVNNGGCMHLCEDTPTGFRCTCRPGYKLVGNASCEDIDECELPGSCSQLCINEKGTYKCECQDGYLRDLHDHTRCKAKEGHASLLFTRRHDIRKVSLDHHEMTAIVNGTKAATALDFVFRTGMIFWSDSSEQKIYKAPIDEGSDRTVVINDQVTMCDGLAVDWIYNHIYWTDTGKNTIELANYEGNMRKVLVNSSMDEPRAIALNPLDGWMYWSDWGKEPRIERAGMDGSHRQVIVSYDIKWPNGIALDLVRQRLYWVDGKLNMISSVNYDGSRRRVVLRSPSTLHHPFSISVFEDIVYWTDWDKQAIYKANKFNGSDLAPVTAVNMLQSPMVVHVYHPYRQPDGVNHCAAVNGHCSHLCLPAPRINDRSPRISCACPNGLTLMKDGLMCSDQPDLDPQLPPPDQDTPDSDPNANDHDQADSGLIAGLAIGGLGLLVAVLAVIAYILYRHYLRRNVTSMNFDNPVYRKTTEDQFSLDKNQFPTRTYPSTVSEECQEPLTIPDTNDYV